MKIVLLVFIISSISLYTKDTVITKNSNEIIGKILEETDTNIVIGINRDNIVTIDKDNIVNIKEERSDIPSEVNKNSSNTIPVFGLTFGTPGIINFTGGVYHEYFGIRASLGYFFTNATGFQIMPGVPIYINKDFFIVPSLPVGTFNELMDLGSTEYIGLGLDTHLYGFTTSFIYALGNFNRGGSAILFDVGYKIAWN